MKAKILVIDDEADLTTILGRFLRDAGFDVRTATSGREGLQQAITMQPDAIILDVMMPDMDGYQVCRQLRRDPRTARTRILILTARGQPVDEKTALQAGADAYLIKPIKSQDLVDSVQRMLDDRGRVGPPLGRQVTVLHLHQGTGATTLSSNLAVCLNEDARQLTVIADLDLQGGQVDDRLGLSRSRSWLEAPTLSDEAVIAHLVRHESGLFALPAPTLDEVSRPDPEIVRHLLQILRRWFDYTIVDTPRNLGNLVAPVLRSSWLILLLLTPDPASLQAARASLTALYHLGASSLQIWPVLTTRRGQALAFARQAEKALGLPVVALLPWSPQDCAEAVASGQPIVTSLPEAPLSKAIRALGRRIVRAGHSSLPGRAAG